MEELVVIKEIELFNLIKENLIPDLIKFEERFNPIDCYSKKYNTYIELKCRNDFYSNLMIEKHKYDILNQYQNARYINSIILNNNIKVISFDIKKLPEPIWEIKMLPNACNELYKGLVPTEVGYYNIGSGINITKQLKL
jgi:hypothetical protein